MRLWCDSCRRIRMQAWINGMKLRDEAGPQSNGVQSANLVRFTFTGRAYAAGGGRANAKTRLEPMKMEDRRFLRSRNDPKLGNKGPPRVSRWKDARVAAGSSSGALAVRLPSPGVATFRKDIGLGFELERASSPRDIPAVTTTAHRDGKRPPVKRTVTTLR